MSQAVITDLSFTDDETAKTMPETRTLLANAVQELRQMRAELDAVEQARAEPIAIIGMGCRFPGAVNPSAFWQLLRRGGHAIREVTPDRWDLNGTLASLPITGENMQTRWSGFLDNVTDFDPEFFGISPREAIHMDPQQRLILEVAWEALESGGVPPAQLSESQTGVYIGLSTFDYARLNFDNPASINAYGSTGVSDSIVANRLSYLLNLGGPSFIVDTACSSSLVAAHIACRALRNGDCSTALVGGINLILTPSCAMMFSKAHMMAPDGRCKTFDAAADGYVRAEGCGIVVLKRLSDAHRNGDNILALIRGTAMNHGGRTNGLTAPSGQAQQAVIKAALRDAGVSAAEIDYIEAHGTGTALGDPIEANAIKAVIGYDPQRDTTCWMGSVKTNIGHMEAAAGMGGLIKTILSLQHEEIPPHLNFNTLNPHISLDDTPLAIPVERQPWLRNTKARLAGINSFGFGGANAHVILEEGPEVASGRWQVAGSESEGEPSVGSSQSLADAKRPLHLLALSAKTPDALNELAQRYGDFLNEDQETSLADICFTAAAGRDHFEHRLALPAANHADLSVALHQFAGGQEVRNIQMGQVSSNQTPKTAFLFTGQGSQYINMGRELYETQPHFRETMDRCDEILRPYLEESILSIMYPSTHPVIQSSSQHDYSETADPLTDDLLNTTYYTQPALFALEYALAQLWISWDIEPDVVMGHSVGEYVAACVAGVFTLEDGLKLVATRGQLMQALSENGDMVAILSDEARVAEVIAPYAAEVSIAAINGPQNVVISGQSEAVQKIVAEIEAADIQTRQLTVSHAFHSPLMEPMLDDFLQVAQGIVYNSPQLPLISNVTGQLATNEVTTPDYWTRHVRNAVRFADGVATLNGQGVDVFLEVGPKPTLLSMAQQILDKMSQSSLHSFTPSSSHPVIFPSLRQGRSDWQQMLDSLGALYVRGMAIHWHAFDAAYGRRKVSLPTYPFQRQRHWLEPAKSQRSRSALRPLIDKMTRTPLLRETVFETEFSRETLPFLDDHRVYESVVAPGAGHLAFVLSAAEVAFDSQSCQIENVLFPEALIIPEEGSRTVQLVLTPHEANGTGPHDTFQLISIDPAYPDERAATHASGQVVTFVSDEPVAFGIDALLQRCQHGIPIEQFYDSVAEQGLGFGPNFRWVTELWRYTPTGTSEASISVEESLVDAEAVGKLWLPEAVTDMTGYLLHPGLLDACFQLAGVARTDDGKTEVLVPFAVESLRLHRVTSGNEWWCHAKQVDTHKWDIQLQDTHGQVIADITGFEMRPIPRALLQSQRIRKEWLYAIDWQAKALVAENTTTFDNEPQATGYWLVFGAKQEFDQSVVKQLQAQGKDVVLVTHGETYTVLHTNDDGRPTQIAVNPIVPEDFQRLLSEIGDDKQTVCAGVIYLWGGERLTNAMGHQDLSGAANGYKPLVAQHESGAVNLQLTGLAYGTGVSSPLNLVDVPTTTLYLCGGLLHLVQALAEAKMASPLWLVAQIPPQPSPIWGGSRHGVDEGSVLSLDSGETDSEETSIVPDEEAVPPPAWGRVPSGRGGGALQALVRTIALEYPQLRCTCIDLDGTSLDENAALLLAELDATDAEHQIAYRQGERYVARLARWQPEPTIDKSDPTQVQLSDYGSPDNLQLVPTQRRTPGPGEVEVEVKAVGLNFRDVLNALGMLRDYYAEHLDIHQAADVPLGFECAGVVVEVGSDVADLAVGDVVMGLANGSLATHVTVPSPSITQIPEELSFEEAATIPLTFLTAWYGLRHRANLQAGERVLIHAAAGGVGQAAVQLAQAVGAEIIATASRGKWDFLHRQGVRHVLNSRTLDFADQVMTITQGAGVDVILNSLSNEFVDRSFSVLGQNGRFVELGKLGIWSVDRVANERPDVSYHPLDLGEELVKEPTLISQLWSDLVEQFATGKLRPLPRTDFPVAHVTAAFRFMQEAKHLGKVVITFEPPERAAVQPGASYLITGGLGALGLQMAEQLVEEGARHLVLTGRQGVTSEETQHTIAQLEEAGTTVQVVQADIAQHDDVVRLLGECQTHAPLRGIVHAAGLIDDGLLPQQSLKRFERVMAPKVAGTWHLHTLTSKMPLDFFVCFSSMASLLGSPGQSNYAAANGFMDALMAQRRAAGLPGLSINWGPWAQVGMAADLQERMRAQGTRAIAPLQGRQFFNLLYNQDTAQIGVLPINWAQFSAQIVQTSGAAFYTTFLQRETQNESSVAMRTTLLGQLQKGSLHERTQLLTAWLQEEIAKVLGLSQPPALQSGLMSLGMDSLMAMELGNRVQDLLGVQLAPTALFEFSTIQELVDHLMAQILTDQSMPVLEEDTVAKTQKTQKESTYVVSEARIPRLASVDQERLMPLSYSQERIWFLEQLEELSPIYNIPIALRANGTLDIAALERTLQEIVQRHESLRTIFIVKDGTPYQVVRDATLQVSHIDLTTLSAEEQAVEVERLSTEEALYHFDLSQDLMLRATLFHLGKQAMAQAQVAQSKTVLHHMVSDEIEEAQYVLLLTMSHAAIDGWSVGVLTRALLMLYDAFRQGKPSPLPTLPIQYTDFARWQRSELDSKEMTKQLAYWRQQLTGAPSLLALPTDRPRSVTQTFHGAYHGLRLPQTMLTELLALSSMQETTLITTLMAALKVLLLRYSASIGAAEDVVVGTSIADRGYQKTKTLIGLFLNHMALRTNLAGNPSFQELLQRVKQTTLDAYAHQTVPLQQVVQELQPERYLPHSPLFQVEFVSRMMNLPSFMDGIDLNLYAEMPEVEKLLANFDINKLLTEGIEGLSLEVLDVEKPFVNFDLIVLLEDGAEGLHINWGYNSDIFNSSTIERMANHYHTLLESILADPTQSIFDLPLLSDSERHQILVGWNETTAAYPHDKCIHQFIEEQAERTPDAIAVLDDAITARRNEKVADCITSHAAALTYRELNERANQLARHLQSLGVGPGTLVGLCIERSPEMVVGLLGILKTGGAYVPLDPIYPQERLAFMLQDTDVSFLVTQALLLESLPPCTAQTICLDREWAQIARQNKHNLCGQVQPDNLAYIGYTSGTAGIPKGVKISHQALINVLWSMKDQIDFSQHDTVLAHTTVAYDIAALELYLPLLIGGKMVIADQTASRDGQALASLLRAYDITLMQATPAIWRRLLDNGWQGKADLKILCGGEAMSPDLSRSLYERSSALWHLYGSAETTLWSVLHRISPTEDRTLIGRPIANTQVYILDCLLNPVPIGVIGELYIGGDGVAAGYLNDPERTEARFIDNPFGPGKLHATGDRARYWPDGTIECLGSEAYHAKIRGFPVELGEIEAVLTQRADIAAAVVLAVETASDKTQLVAYIVPEQQQEAAQVESDGLRTFLQQRMPHYMVPAAFVMLEALPLTPNGKVDRRSLPAPDESSLAIASNYVPPRTPIEETVAAIWREVLDVEQAGIHDNFFALGGHSLLAVPLMTRVREQFDQPLPISLLFQQPTIAQLATAIEQDSRSIRDATVFAIP